jgi:glycine/serine hydroxymethyltransferase
MKETLSQDFKDYAHQAIKNSRILCEILIDKGYKIIGGKFLFLFLKKIFVIEFEI